MRGFKDEDEDYQREERERLDAFALTVKVLCASSSGKAIKISDGTRAAWCPRVLLRERSDDPRTGLSTIIVPEWFARQEGFL